MALCDRLEAMRAERETTRDRLAASSLARLNAPDPETFQEDARFVLDALPAFTTRPDQIKKLRQTILNLAVRGKLVPQDPNDEPASELLNRIANEIAAYSKANRIGQTKAEPISVDCHSLRRMGGNGRAYAPCSMSSQTAIISRRRKPTKVWLS